VYCPIWKEFYWAEHPGGVWKGTGALRGTDLEEMLMLWYPRRHRLRILDLSLTYRNRVPTYVIELRFEENDEWHGAQSPLRLKRWFSSQFRPMLRHQAVGRWFVRSGRGTATALVDLDALTVEPIPSAPRIMGFGAAYTVGERVWLYGADPAGQPVLVRIDPASREVEHFDPSGLPHPAHFEMYTKYNQWMLHAVDQDLIADDGSHLWKMRFEQGHFVIGAMDLHTHATAIYRAVGHVRAANELFQRVDGDIKDCRCWRHPNGFRPPEPLKVLVLGKGDLVVARQQGKFAAVRIRLGCK
jgi:hypothetical protein